MQNHHHLYPYPQLAAASHEREAGSAGKKPAAEKRSDPGTDKAKASWIMALPNAIAQYREASAKKKKDKQDQLAKWKEQQKNLRMGATVCPFIILTALKNAFFVLTAFLLFKTTFQDEQC